jgi:putative GTP pyrophosphokinase
MCLDEILKDWDSKKQLHEKFTEYLGSRIEEIVHQRGIMARVVTRTKEDVSIAKKLYKDGITFQNYLDMADKSGARIICKFKEDVEMVADYIREEFEILKEEDKSSFLKLNEIGYKSLHFDIRLKKEYTSNEIFQDFGELIGEIQVRTLCEDIWAEINHDIGYKSLGKLPDEIARQIYCLGGLFEIADSCISEISNKTLKSPTLDEYCVLKILEPFFIRLVRRAYDRELSLKALGILLPLPEISTPDEFKKIMGEFIDRNGEKINNVLDERKDHIKHFPYLTQPELFLIFYMIEKKPFILVDRWELAFPIEDLAKLFLWWGRSISDFTRIL